MYFPGQRRVSRLPAFDYDNPIPGYENLETADQYPMFAGMLDRYDWKLVGKQEMYIPYNSFKFVAKRQGHRMSTAACIRIATWCATSCTASGRSRPR
jgi:hypothetical protein